MSEIIVRLSQGSILGSLLSNIFLNYLFVYAKEKFLNYCTGDNILQAIGHTTDRSKKATILKLLETSFKKT